MSNPSQEKEQKAETLIAVRSVRVVISGLMWEATGYHLIWSLGGAVGFDEDYDLKADLILEQKSDTSCEQLVKTNS